MLAYACSQHDILALALNIGLFLLFFRVYYLRKLFAPILTSRELDQDGSPASSALSEFWIGSSQDEIKHSEN